MAENHSFNNQTEVRWCPGCGDHVILKHLQTALSKMGNQPTRTAIVSGIGCAARLPYYVNSYGFHTIHGRALPIARGLKLAQPDMDVWVILGDGDGLSIGGNHFIHFFRKNPTIHTLLFNNQIYGLTKGQYSPTSHEGLITKTSPQGTHSKPLEPLPLALISGATFISRTYDKDSVYIQDYIIAARNHPGASLVEILQNCIIFNDGVFETITDRNQNHAHIIRLEEGKPLFFGNNNEKVIELNGFTPLIKNSSEANPDKIWIHNSKDKSKAFLLSSLGYNEYSEFPVAIGIIYNHQVDNENIPKNENYDEQIQGILDRDKIYFK